jgi:hypothetical protein
MLYCVVSALTTSHTSSLFYPDDKHLSLTLSFSLFSRLGLSDDNHFFSFSGDPSFATVFRHAMAGQDATEDMLPRRYRAHVFDYRYNSKISFHHLTGL